MPRALFLGTEASGSPDVPALQAAAARLVAVDLSAATLSARFGPRAVVNAAMPLDALGRDDFVEIADYDPHNDHVLCIGRHEPAHESALHALVYRAKKEVGAVAQVTGNASGVEASVPRVVRGRTTVETALRVLEALRSADTIVLGEKQLLAVGRTPEEAVGRALRALGHVE